MPPPSTPTVDPESLPFQPTLGAVERTNVQNPEDAERFHRQLDGRSGPELPPGYRYVDKLGRGGMGVVYRAVQTDLGREVALKMILSGDYASEEELLRFETEVKLVAAVKHPNVVQVHHAGRHNDLPFLDLEFLAGGSLADLLRDGPLAARDAAGMVEQIARGVAACHAVGILHRDLKPGNVLLAGPPHETGDTTKSVPLATNRASQTLRIRAGIVPKVADFGLARRLDSADGLTRPGVPLGTPSYMPPEQARGETLDARADVYSLGAILYATLTGRPPFQSPSPTETMRRVIHDDPLPVRELQPTTPRDLETIALKCLAKDRGSRYATAAELADDLKRWLDGQPIRARRAGPIERSWKLVRRNPEWTVAFLALAIGFGVAVQQAYAANRARAATERESKQKGANSEFFIDVLSQSSAARQSESGRTVNPKLSVKEALDYATENIGSRFDGQPAIEAEVRANLGRIYHELRQYPEAAKQFGLVLDLQDRYMSPDDPLRASIRISLGDCLRNTGDLDGALKHLNEALERAERKACNPVDVPKCLNNLALVYRSQGKSEQAQSFFERALESRRRLLADASSPDDRIALRKDVARSLNNVGGFHFELGQYDRAEPYFVEALRERTELLGRDHTDTISTMRNLAENTDWMETKPAEAERLFRAVLAATHRSEPETWIEASDELRLARFLIWQSRFDDADRHIGSGYHCLKHCGKAPPDTFKDRIRQMTDEIRERRDRIGADRTRAWLEKLDELRK